MTGRLPRTPRRAEVAAALPPGRLPYDLKAPELLLHTVQTREAYDTLRRTGVLHGEPALVDEDFVAPYAWIAEQVRARVSPPLPAGTAPVWAWARTTRRSLLDQLRVDARQRPGSVLLTLRVDRSRVLLSSFLDWHLPLNDAPVPPTWASDGEGYTAWSAGWEGRWGTRQGCDLRRRPGYGETMEATWPAIFDIGVLPRRYPVQACLSVLRAADVVDVVEPVAGGRATRTPAAT